MCRAVTNTGLMAVPPAGNPGNPENTPRTSENSAGVGGEAAPYQSEDDPRGYKLRI